MWGGGKHFLLLIAFLNFQGTLKVITCFLMPIKSHIMTLRKSTSHGLAAESENEVYHMNIISCVNGGIDGTFGMVLSHPVVTSVFTFFIHLQS